MTSKNAQNNPQNITCNVCPGQCKSYAYYPACDPHNPAVPFLAVKTHNYATNDFFGQFIKKKTIRKLTAQELARYIDRIFILCPNCYAEKLGNATDDGYLICSRCSTHFDLVLDRAHKRISYPADVQLDFSEIPF